MNGISKVDTRMARQIRRSQWDEVRYFGRDWPAFWRRLNTRRTLLKLDEQQLRDIGLTRAEAEREANLPFWRL